mgnify:CR=1 FL=1
MDIFDKCLEVDRKWHKWSEWFNLFGHYSMDNCRCLNDFSWYECVIGGCKLLICICDQVIGRTWFDNLGDGNEQVDLIGSFNLPWVSKVFISCVYDSSRRNASNTYGYSSDPIMQNFKNVFSSPKCSNTLVPFDN